MLVRGLLKSRMGGEGHAGIRYGLVAHVGHLSQHRNSDRLLLGEIRGSEQLGHLRVGDVVGVLKVAW